MDLRRCRYFERPFEAPQSFDQRFIRVRTVCQRPGRGCRPATCRHARRRAGPPSSPRRSDTRTSPRCTGGYDATRSCRASVASIQVCSGPDRSRIAAARARHGTPIHFQSSASSRVASRKHLLEPSTAWCRCSGSSGSIKRACSEVGLAPGHRGDTRKATIAGAGCRLVSGLVIGRDGVEQQGEHVGCLQGRTIQEKMPLMNAELQPLEQKEIRIPLSIDLGHASRPAR